MARESSQQPTCELPADEWNELYGVYQSNDPKRLCHLQTLCHSNDGLSHACKRSSLKDVCDRASSTCKFSTAATAVHLVVAPPIHERVCAFVRDACATAPAIADEESALMLYGTARRAYS